MTKRPNIFDYATSELSQDAFLAWLIQWASKDCGEIDDALNACAIRFVQELLGEDSSYGIGTIEVGRQKKNIDVWAIVNNQYFLVIEDKKQTKQHSDQLERYSKYAKEEYGKLNLEVKLVYFKMEEQGDYSEVKKSGYFIFRREKMLSILEHYISSTEDVLRNDIIVDFYKKIDNLNKEIKGFLTEPLCEWEDYAWQGFYSELQKDIDGNWDYVPNASGGFLGFWWSKIKCELNGKQFEIYLQLEEDKMVFKLYVERVDERVEVRNFYRRHLLKKASELEVEISKFGRLGAYMGVAKLDSEYRITNENGLLDMKETVKRLKIITNLIKETETEIIAQN